MKKMQTLKINGMMCEHCAKHASDALLKIDGVTKVKVDLENKKALVVTNKEVNDDVFKDAIADAGYTLESIE